MIRVLLVDDHVVVAQGLSAAFGGVDDVDVVAIADGFTRAVEVMTTTELDVVITDHQLGDGFGAALADVAAGMADGPAVLVFTGMRPGPVVEAALRHGCAGVVMKTQPFDEVVAALRAVAFGAAVFPAGLLASLHGAAEPVHTLTAREMEVLDLMARAVPVNEMAATLFISPHTARNHVKQILSKLDARSQLEAVVIAHRRGLVSIEGPDVD